VCVYKDTLYKENMATTFTFGLRSVPLQGQYGRDIQKVYFSENIYYSIYYIVYNSPLFRKNISEEQKKCLHYFSTKE
jgi:hypothetical protein